mmetsp:Transcript_12718/g.25917  ORF Transcript_12718/g.25917 Transcript_12718/m.25917 type:complete len:196 (+) Transcript_12718:144-731(+)
MVKHGGNKKRRSTSRQNKAMSGSHKVAKYKNPRSLFRNQTVASNWNPSTTPLENLKNMGLKALPNDDIKKPSGLNDASTSSSSSPPVPSKAIELFDIPLNGMIKGKTRADVMLPVSVDDQEYIVRLLKRHRKRDVDYKKMERDTKVNDRQLSAAKVRKLAVKFAGMEKKDRRVEVGDEVEKVLEKVREKEEEGEE